MVNVWYNICDMKDKVVTRGKPFQSKLALYEAGVFRQTRINRIDRILGM